jgi:hypothetical protein
LLPPAVGNSIASSVIIISVVLVILLFIVISSLMSFGSTGDDAKACPSVSSLA